MPNPLQLFVMYIYLKMLKLAFLLTIKRKSKGKRNIETPIQSEESDIKSPNNQSNFDILSYDYTMNPLSKDQYNPLLEGTARINHNPKTLLALRTFGKPQTADFLFHIANKWVSNYGHTVCLMDARLAEYEFGMLKYTLDISEGFYQERLKSNHSMKFTLMAIACGTLYVVGPIAGSILTVYMADLHSIVENYFVSFYLVVGCVIPWLLPFFIMLCFTQSLYVKIDKSILKVTQSPEFINKRSPSPKNPFCLYTFYCLPGSWHFCLEMLLEQADAIVMDIRGIAKENIGCKYEVTLLSERDLLRKTTFIIDGESDRQFLLSTLSDLMAKGTVNVADLPRLKTDWSGYEGSPKWLMNKVRIALKYEPSETFSLLKTIYNGNEFGEQTGGRS